MPKTNQDPSSGFEGWVLAYLLSTVVQAFLFLANRFDFYAL